MKNKLVIVGFVVCLFSGIYFVDNKKNDLPVLMLDNIEALASGEHGDGVYCYGEGSVECDGDWVEMKITGVRIK